MKITTSARLEGIPVLKKSLFWPRVACGRPCHARLLEGVAKVNSRGNKGILFTFGIVERQNWRPQRELPPRAVWRGARRRQREFFSDNLLVRIHFIIVMIRWTGLAPWEFEFSLGLNPKRWSTPMRVECWAVSPKP